MKCPACRLELETDAEKCPRCGADLRLLLGIEAEARSMVDRARDAIAREDREEALLLLQEALMLDEAVPGAQELMRGLRSTRPKVWTRADLRWRLLAWIAIGTLLIMVVVGIAAAGRVLLTTVPDAFGAVARVEEALGRSPGLKGVTIAATPQGHAIRLEGLAASPGQEELARLVAAAAAPGWTIETVPSPGQSLRTRVEAALGGELRLRRTSIAVLEEAGHVTLQGEIGTLEEVLEAAQVAASVTGVSSVDVRGLTATLYQPAGYFYVLQPGDTLWDLAQEFYGESDLWPAIAAENPEVDPVALSIGAAIVIPVRR